jgi:hypothetical protein
MSALLRQRPSPVCGRERPKGVELLRGSELDQRLRVLEYAVGISQVGVKERTPHPRRSELVRPSDALGEREAVSDALAPAVNETEQGRDLGTLRKGCHPGIGRPFVRLPLVVEGERTLQVVEARR